MNKILKIFIILIFLAVIAISIFYFFYIKPKDVAKSGVVECIESIANKQTDFLILDLSSLPEDTCYWITSKNKFDINEWSVEVWTYTDAKNCTYGTLANTTEIKLDTPVSVTGKQCICYQNSILGQLITIAAKERSVQDTTVRSIDIK